MSASGRLYLTGRDPELAVTRRCAARLLSAYERAPLRAALATEAIGPLDRWLVALACWAIARPSGQNAPASTHPPSSGWRGNVLFAGLWTALIVATAALAR